MVDVDLEGEAKTEVIDDKTETAKHAIRDADDATKRLRMERHRNVATNHDKVEG